MTPPPAIVLIALGSNLGDSADAIRRALERLAVLSSTRMLGSSLWVTTPVECPPGSPRFLNAAARLTSRPGDTPESFLGELHAIEHALGRRPKQILNEARPIDLDLLAWGDETRHTPVLVLPHPRAHLRRFVLEPLAEIAPDFRWPGQDRTIRELLGGLVTSEVVERI